MMMQNNAPRIIRPNAGFILPGSRFLEVELPCTKIGMAGEYKIIKHKQGFVLQEIPWFDNIILDAGLNRWAVGSIIGGIGIGTGTSTPAAGQSGLDAEVHFATTGGTGAGVAAGSAPNYNNTRTVVYRTSLGALNGNYSEVAVGWAAGNNKFSRALILDGGGSPTTIAVSAAEQLDIWYRYSIYPPLVDTTDVVVIGGVSYTFTGRASQVTNVGVPRWNVGTGPVQFGQSVVNTSFFTGGIGAITGGPSGTESQRADSSSTAAYSSNSYTLTGQSNFGLTAGNVAGGGNSVLVHWGDAGSQGYGAFQYGISPVFPKDATKTCSMGFRYSWARRP